MNNIDKDILRTKLTKALEALYRFECTCDGEEARKPGSVDRDENHSIYLADAIGAVKKVLEEA